MFAAIGVIVRTPAFLLGAVLICVLGSIFTLFVLGWYFLQLLALPLSFIAYASSNDWAGWKHYINQIPYNLKRDLSILPELMKDLTKWWLSMT